MKLKQVALYFIIDKGQLLVFKIFFLKPKNIFIASFSGVKVCDAFASRSPLGKSLTLAFENLGLKPFSDFGKKFTALNNRPFPTAFLLVQKGFVKFSCF